MTSALPIARARPADLGLDQPKLYAIGLDRLRAIAGATWTDHNVHDPGITTLELVTYALTDLAYRASFPIEDLLGESDQFVPLSAAKMLPNQPLTILDYRKLMIDVPGIKNAWLEPIEPLYFADLQTGEILLQKPNKPGIKDVLIRGIYVALIEYDDPTISDVQKQALQTAVLTRLQAHRNLCEDFAGVRTVQHENFLLCGEVELTPDADAPSVHLEILREVQSYLAPGVRRYSRDEMLAKVKPDGTPNAPADLFDGPLLEHGFIDSAELEAADLRRDVRLSDIISRVMDIPGVRAVRELVIGPEPPPNVTTPIENRWLVPVEPGKQATLNTAKCRLVYYKGSMPIVPSAVPSLPAAAAPAVVCDDVPIPRGRKRNVGSYTSFQNHYPAVYGIGEHRLPDSTPVRRRALAKQLKAYLLFFDQVMANFCAQLSKVAELFEVETADTPTYFAQVVSTAPEFLSIYGVAPANLNTLAASLGVGVETVAARHARRTRFLDHLIARIAERVHDYAEIMKSAFGATVATLLEDRRSFLEAYPVLGRDRGLGYNYTLSGANDLWNTSANVSGLEKRLARLLGIGDVRRRDLTTVAPGADTAITNPAPNEFGYTLTDGTGANAKTLLRHHTTSASAALATAQMLRAFELGQWSSTYVRTQNPDATWFFTIVGANNEVVGRSENVASAALIEEAIVALRTYLRRHYSREGFHVIENILLRPEQAADAALHFCIEPGCVDCGGEDPYSWRVHVILPAYAGRFNDMGFRRFVEDAIREEVPAHILPKICWIDEATMQTVQTAYHDWLEVRSGGAVAQRTARIAALVKALTEVKSVYPVQKLVACSGAAEPKFILGQTALGTKHDND